jgi:dCMP deaminase
MANHAKWDQRFLDLAFEISSWSKESGRRVGAVVVGPDREIRATGYNGLPRGVDDDRPERHSRRTGAKYLWSSHAERNAIYNAARVGTALKGCTIYVQMYPCHECAKAIIQAGIACVVTAPPDLADPQWRESFDISATMFKEAGVKVRKRPQDRPLLRGDYAEPEPQ